MAHRVPSWCSATIPTGAKRSIGDGNASRIARVAERLSHASSKARIDERVIMEDDGRGRVVR